ncbi:MAG TPA: RcnB family protein [Ramlibacter sp.]|uniref:RcnB family protein n=1 Tax=Ramlibacter sp. TaxID=1917967 RepID=UPI002D7FD387|nr:RcnB family protein [Ramlibacter sp.]HET8746132.1 RcnB family protein [Ramlibacter sp.]
MKSRTIVCSLVIASLGFGTVSFAQPSHHGHDAREARHDARDARHDAREREHRREAREREARREARHYYNARGPEFRRGHRLPPELRNRQYVVSNWRAHRLSPPPRGYHWVQVGPDYVLVAIATGVILNLILSQ